MSRNRSGATLMLVAIAGSSLMPLLVALGSIETPFLFNSALIAGSGVGSASLLLIAYRSLLFNKDVWGLVWRKTLSFPMLLWVIGYLDVAFYAWSVQYIDVTLSMLLFGTWPILLMLVTERMFRREERFRRPRLRTLILIFLAFTGFAPVIGSQFGGLTVVGGSSLTTLAMGIALGLGAAFLTSLSAFGFRWGTDIARELSGRFKTHSQIEMEMFGVVVGMVVCCLITLPVNLLAGLGRGESPSRETAIFGLAAGIVVVFFSGYVWRRATLVTRDLSIHAIAYLDPVLGLGWLFAFSLVGDMHLGYFLIGAALILAANAAIYFSELVKTCEVAPELVEGGLSKDDRPAS